LARISRHYSDNHLIDSTFETRVAIYEDQIRGWFHDQARILEKNSDHAGFVLLLVSLTYVEGHAIFLRGEDSKRKSPEFFRKGFKEVFKPQGPSKSIIDRAVNALYEEVRCGLFHTGMTKGKVILGRYEESVRIELNSTGQAVSFIQIDPHKMLDQIEAHLSSYVTRLRNPKENELRNNFDSAWRLRFGQQDDPERHP